MSRRHYPRPNRTSESLPLHRLTCRGLICTLFRLMTRALRNEAREMAEEVGTGGAITVELHPSVNRLHSEVLAIWNAKWALHEVLQGDQEDVDLLHQAKMLMGELEEKVVHPLKRIEREPSASAKTARIRALGRVASRIVRRGMRFHKQAEHRFREALLLSEVPSERAGAVVALDMARYSEFALDLEGSLDSRALFEFNSDIERRFRKAIQAVGGDPADTPLTYTGDGALVFFASPILAVQFALKVQADAFERNLNIRPSRGGGRRRRFRIGIRTGKYCMQAHRDVGGRLLGFSVAGVSVIDAVRIQSACAEDEILICGETRQGLPEALRKKFGRQSMVPTKPHERRVIRVWG